MIKDDEIVSIGKVNKTHGIKGELSVIMYADLDVQELTCVVFDIDGIYVPFFVKSTRPRSAESVLVTIDGIESDEQALQFVGKEMYALADDVDVSDDDGYYLDEFVGYKIEDVDGSKIGIIDGYDDSTENVLFIVEAHNKTIYVPVAPEFFVNIDNDGKIIVMDLPTGLVDM